MRETSRTTDTALPRSPGSLSFRATLLALVRGMTIHKAA